MLSLHRVMPEHLPELRAAPVQVVAEPPSDVAACLRFPISRGDRPAA